MPLKHVLSVTRATAHESGSRPFAFALRTDLEGGRAFIFCAMSDEDLEGWLGAVHAACALTHGAGITDALQSK